MTRVTELTPTDLEVGPGTNDYTITPTGDGGYYLNIHGFGGPAIETSSANAQFDRGSALWDFGADILEIAKADVAIDLTYSNFGNYTWVEGNNGYVSFFAAGTLTVGTDMPISGNASYSGIVDGLWYDGNTLRRLYGSTASLNVDFATDVVTSTLNLVGRLDPFGDYMSAPATNLATFQGQGTLTQPNFFTGNYTTAAGYSGTFGGTFFGPAAAEYGLTFSLTGANGGRASGVSVGKRS